MARHAVQPDGQAMFFEYQVEGRRWSWSQGLRDLHGLDEGEEPTTEAMLARIVLDDRAAMLSRFQHHLEDAGPYSCVYTMTDAHGRARRLVLVGRSEAVAGTVKRLTGFVADITEAMREGARVAVAASAENRAAIEQAKGALMVTFGIDEDVAFDLLRTYSSQHNIKLAAVADRIVDGLGDPAFSREEPARSLLDIVIGLAAEAGDGTGVVTRSSAGGGLSGA
ncbi:MULTISPECIES: ANTAR domain-containing protein [unclassified Phycicoccus]|uniref:ANTAR domain-containing protein n=1 Tax=unclassified Phycicoccus TaxID=2637926 RepID=UPI000AFF587B|nr:MULTISPECIES: ANTAR domain-containing protein [unclassified Phycicoccus]